MKRISRFSAALALVVSATPVMANQTWGVMGDNIQCTMVGPEFNFIVRWERGSDTIDAIFRSEAFVPIIDQTRIFRWAFAWPDSDPVPPTWTEPSKILADKQDITVPHQSGYHMGAITLTQPIDPFLSLLAKEHVIQIYTEDAGDSLWLDGSADGVRRLRECMHSAG